MTTRSRCISVLVASLVALAACKSKKTRHTERPTTVQTGTEPESAPSTEGHLESEPESQPESAPVSATSDDPYVGPGPWVYSHSIGTPGDAPGQFREPVGLAVTPDGDLFVSDAGNKRMQKLSARGESRAVFADGIGRPMHLSWSGEKRLVVAVFLEDRIRFFDDTEESGALGGDWLDAPAAAVQAKDGRYYVADFYHHQFHIVSADGARLKSVGGKGEADGEFTYPTDVALHPDGNVWVADAYAHRLQKFSPEGEHLTTIGGRGTTAGRFQIATGIDVGADGSLYVADFGNGRIQVLAPDGTPKAIFGPGGDGARSLKRPTDVVAVEGHVYVVDHGHHQIDVWEKR